MKKVYSDLFLNLLAAVLPMFILQFFILPLISQKTSGSEYGQILTLVSIVGLLGGTLGNVLNNVKLITFSKYKEKSYSGDFSFLLIVFLMINIIGNVIYVNISSIDQKYLYILLVLSSLLLLRNYGTTEFRINLNYKLVLIESLMMLTGYIVGLLVFIINGTWSFVYLFGYTFSLLFIFSKTKIFFEPLKATPLHKETSIQAGILLLSGLLVALGTYVDRLILYPMLGGYAVTIYYVSTVFGKTISLLIQPLTSLMLSYFAKLDKFNSRNFYIIFLLSTLFGILSYICTIVVGGFLLKYIYPQYVEEAWKYIHITTISIIFTLISNILNPILLKFRKTIWQIVINSVYMGVYIVASVLFLRLYGLMGFCVGILVASIVKLVLTILFYYFGSKE